MKFCCSYCGMVRETNETDACQVCKRNSLVVPWIEFMPLETGTVVTIRLPKPYARMRQRKDGDFDFQKSSLEMGIGTILTAERSEVDGHVRYKVNASAGDFVNHREPNGDLWVAGYELRPVAKRQNEN